MDDIDDEEEEDADGKRGITYQVNFAFGWELAIKRGKSCNYSLQLSSTEA
jgi:hypothetical protein